ncbi:dolichyl-phosphate-mannose--protein mannosyltransferase [Leptospira biflexa]|uniref:ArnT family glycosyltransferase n=1 Tax=Leptospira biflexa TaxID=172 RepID=UPI00109102AC|nr:glycosyltransferase family 39 protein [Leptospira biflexa]TGM46845.1 dolichyl-phosphate-mannose--protein mannosyltransferase [Leptospira biflexa]TGM50689.1 dolichyl-phosphate-mannose--protein mannosyltransferase [Leptospira biflexa]
MAYASFFIISILYCLQVGINIGVLPVVWPDEVLFYSPAISFANTGHLKTEVLSGLIPGMESKTLWMPPFYLLFSGFTLTIFPDSILTLRIANVCIVYLTAFGFYRLLKRFFIPEFGAQIAFASLLWEPLLFRFGTVARMEALTAFFFILSLFFATNKKVNKWNPFFAGVLLSLSALSHPIGASFGLVTLFLVYQNFKLKNIVWFLLGGIFPILCWMVYIHPNWDWFQIQFGAQLTRKQNLLNTFTIIDKIKIFSFGFGFPKIRILIILIQLFLLSFFTYKQIRNNGTLLNSWLLFWIWIISVFAALYTSSEGWYVYHSLFPLSLGMALLVQERTFVNRLPVIGISLSLFALVSMHHIHWSKTNSLEIQTSHFQHIQRSLSQSNAVYLQSLPDPYFYLKSKRPDLDILEFIPGELEIPSETYINTIRSRDSFVFYDETLINETIKDYLKQGSWIREEWEIPVPSNHWLHYKTIVYTKQ